MDKISLKVVVAGRSYPLSLNPGEEEKVNRAAEDINNAIQVLKENYAVKDMQDLLAMAALQLATKSSQSNPTITPTDYSSVEKALDDLVKEIGDL
jgi:cell division protein ZapA (FtsZ GTPase activity inhibitor)